MFHSMKYTQFNHFTGGTHPEEHSTYQDRPDTKENFIPLLFLPSFLEISISAQASHSEETFRLFNQENTRYFLNSAMEESHVWM